MGTSMDAWMPLPSPWGLFSNTSMLPCRWSSCVLSARSAGIHSETYFCSRFSLVGHVLHFRVHGVRFCVRGCGEAKKQFIPTCFGFVWSVLLSPCSLRFVPFGLWSHHRHGTVHST